MLQYQLDSVPPTSPFRGLAVWARSAFEGATLQPHLDALLGRIQTSPTDAAAILDASIVLQLLGRREEGLAFQARALAIQSVYRIASAKPTAMRLLVWVVPGDLAENNALEFLLEHSGISLEIIYLTSDTVPEMIPEHDAAMVAICESDRNRTALKRLHDIVSDWPRPLINLPRHIARLSRDGVCNLLSDRAGLSLPPTVRVDRRKLKEVAETGDVSAAVGRDTQFPIVVRPIDSHKGQGQAKVDSAQEVVDYLAARPEHEFFAAPFVDYRNSDGLYRKYRVLLIDGEPFLCHLAVSSHWMVHYMNAGMADSPQKRAEEAAAMQTFERDLARRHEASFGYLARTLGLEYVGIDCAETQDGRLLIFELDAGMTIHSMDSAELYPYKKPQMRKVFNAFEAMLLRRSSIRVPSERVCDRKAA